MARSQPSLSILSRQTSSSSGASRPLPVRGSITTGTVHETAASTRLARSPGSSSASSLAIFSGMSGAGISPRVTEPSRCTAKPSFPWLSSAPTHPAVSGLEQDLHRVVLLLLEDLVAVRPLVERQLVGVEALDAQGVAVAREERHYVVHPALDVGLAHRELYLLVEEREHRQRICLSPVDPAQGDRAAAAHGVDGLVEGVEPVGASLVHDPLGDGVRQDAGELLREPGGGRSVGLHPYRVYDRVGTPPVGHLADLARDVVVIVEVEH